VDLSKGIRNEERSISGDNRMREYKRYTIYVLEGEPQLPENVKVITGISSDWSITPEGIAANLAVNFNFIRDNLSKHFNMSIPHEVVVSGHSIEITPELVLSIWKKQHKRIYATSVLKRLKKKCIKSRDIKLSSNKHLRSEEEIRSLINKLVRFKKLHKPYEDETEEARILLFGKDDESLISDYFYDDECAVRLIHILQWVLCEQKEPIKKNEDG
jgi:hypothetical protein